MNDDLISRAEAIDILDAYQVMVENGEENPYAWARLRMSELSSAQPERKKGKWINIRHDNIAECSRCGITGRAWMNFCFDCGADMREETK